MPLSDKDIRERIEDGELTIEPYEPDNIEPASVDLRLGKDHELVRGGEHINEFEYDDLEKEPLIVPPGSFILTTTLERVEIPTNLVGHVIGRSSVGRLGVSIHQTAGYIDPGFRGQITLELCNHGPAFLKFTPGQRICQIVFEQLSSPAEEPYGHDGSQYQNQSGATRSSMEFE